MRQEHGHLRSEELSIQFHRAIAEKLRDNPEAVLAVTRQNIAHWRRTHSGTGGASYYFDRWDAMLKGPLDELLAFLGSPCQEARDMRQCSPFAGVLSHKERWGIIRCFSGDWMRRPKNATR